MQFDKLSVFYKKMLHTAGTFSSLAQLWHGLNKRQAAGKAPRPTQADLVWGVAGSSKVRKSVYLSWPHPEKGLYSKYMTV